MKKAEHKDGNKNFPLYIYIKNKEHQYFVLLLQQTKVNTFICHLIEPTRNVCFFLFFNKVKVPIQKRKK